MSDNSIHGLMALTDKGFEINILNENARDSCNLLEGVKSYQIREPHLVIATDTHLKLLYIRKKDSLYENVLIWEREYGRVKQIEIKETTLDKDGDLILIGCLLHSKQLKILMFNKNSALKDMNVVEICTFENAASFKLSDRTVFVQFGRDLVIYSISYGLDTDESCLVLNEIKKIPSVNDFFLRGPVLFVWTGQLAQIYKQNIKLNRTHTNGTSQDENVITSIEMVMTFTFAQVDSLDVKISEKGNFVLCCSTSTATGGSYFGHKELFLFNLREKTSRKIQLANIHTFEFIKGGYSVCYGVQPAKAAIFEYSGETKRVFKEGARNRIYFNKEHNYVCFAGFDNLNGMIEVFNVKSGKMIGSLRMLGASQVIWSPCSRYFAVAITNALKVENKIVVYDYFGREKAKKDFNNLSTCDWIGEKEPFSELAPPSKSIFYTEESVYVPPSFGSLGRSSNKRK